MPPSRIRILIFLFAALGFAACSNDPNPPPFAKHQPDGTPWRVRYSGLSEDPRSFDPQFSYDQMSRRVLECVYDTLLEYHPLKTDPYEVRPAMLEAVPEKEVSPDGAISYLCRLKRGIRYHDDECFPGGKGREVVAEDVHFAFQRLCDPKIESPFHANLAEYVLDLQEAHDEAEKTGAFDYQRRLKGVEVIDSHTFRIHLGKAYPQIIFWLAMHCTTPVAREAVEYYDGKVHDGKLRGDFRKFQTVGTGPFRVVQYVPRQRVRLIRAWPPGEYRTTTFPEDGIPPEKEALLRPLAGKPLPFLDEVHFAIIRENIPIFILTRQGYLDGMAVNKDAFAAMITPERELSDKFRDRGMVLEKDVDVATFWIAINMDDPLLGKNKKLRQALSCAYDRQSYSDIFYNSVAPPAEQLMPPGLYGYDREWKNPYGYDPDKGRKLMAEAGFPNGIDPRTGRPLEIVMDTVAAGSEDRQRSEFVQRCFSQLGIRIKVNENTFARLLEKQDTGDFALADGTGWGADYPDPENFFFLFYSKNMPPRGKNASRYNSPEFDKVFEEMATMDNGPERLTLVRRMNEILAEDCPLILTFHKAFYTSVQPWSPRVHGNMMLEGGVKYLLLDPELRERKRQEWNEKPIWPLVLACGLLIGGIGYAIRWNLRNDA
jgi:oligopeptide transport system substrate-binding protein